MRSKDDDLTTNSVALQLRPSNSLLFQAQWFFETYFFLFLFLFLTPTVKPCVARTSPLGPRTGLRVRVSSGAHLREGYSA